MMTTMTGDRMDTDAADMVGKHASVYYPCVGVKEEEEISPIDIFTDDDKFIAGYIQNTLKHKGV